MPERPIDRLMNDPSRLKPVDIRSFRNVTRDINFDVFLKLSEDNVVQVFSRTTGLDYKRLAQYLQKGVKELYILPEDVEAYRAFIAIPADFVFNDPNTPQEKKIATLLNISEQNMAELFAQLNVEEETAMSCKRVIRNYVNLMAGAPQTLVVILKLVSHGEYLYYHSIAVAIFSLFMGKASGLFNQKTIEMLAMGGFIHDIGCTQLPKEIVSGLSELNEEQWKQMRTHPGIGLKMIEGATTIPDEVRYIVYQHHEQPCGRGYPNKIRGSSIYYPAKIIALADAFSALISNRPYRPAHSVEQAIKVLQQETEQGKFDRELMRIVASVFMRQAPKQKAA